MHVRSIGRHAGRDAHRRRWLGAFFVGGRGRNNPTSLLDNAPLARLLSAMLDLRGIRHSIDKGICTQ
jgi:hypothetical protein